MVQHWHTSVFLIRSGNLSFHTSEMSFSIPKIKLTRQIWPIKKNVFGQMCEGKKEIISIYFTCKACFNILLQSTLNITMRHKSEGSQKQRNFSKLSCYSRGVWMCSSILNFNIAILATKTALKHHWKSSITLANTIANIMVNTRLYWNKNRLLRSTHNWTQWAFFLIG